MAEARARKRKRALAKLKNAKKIANATAESSELSGREKLKAIARAMRSAKTDKASKIYVVTKKTGAGSVGTKSSNDKVIYECIVEMFVDFCLGEVEVRG